jgi:hypothetical protein
VSLRGYPREWLVLLLVALGTLPLVSVLGAQDTSRLALTQSIALRGAVDIDPYWQDSIDRAFAHGHWYSDKAPGVSLLAVPLYEAIRVEDAIHPPAHPVQVWDRKWHVWAIRVLTGGVAFLALTLLVGRVAEGFVERAGAPVAVTFGLGTMAGSLGPTVFGHLQDALALFAAFIIGSRARRPRDWLWVGLLAGVGVLFEYPAGLAAVVLVVYAALRGGRRAALATCVGGIPAAIVLGGYDWIAFGAPWRLSYRYTSNVFTAGQRQGFFGVNFPTGHGLWALTFDGHGLLLVSPVLIAAGAGLVLFWRRSRLEAGVAVAISLLFCLYTAGYFLPNGGTSPGPRFAAAALPFLFLGVPYALARWPLPTLVLSAVSVGVGLFDELTWSVANRLAFLAWPETIWSLLGLSRRGGSIVLLACGAATALLVFAAVVGRRFEVRPQAVVKS